MTLLHQLVSSLTRSSEPTGTGLENTLANYLTAFPKIPGWFTPESMVVWDFFLQTQRRLGVSGDFFEIGVYRGKSAVLGAHYLRPTEWCVLVDINPVPEARAMIESFRKERNSYVCCPSATAHAVAEVRSRFGSCRWVHVDGAHKGWSVANDLGLAAELLNDDGIICVDDFFSFRYPQVTAATQRFLFERQPEFQLVFAGSNKGYICREAAFQRYDDAIRQHFLATLEAHQLKLQLNRTSHSSDGGCFTLSWREGDRSLVGLDEDLDTIVS